MTLLVSSLKQRITRNSTLNIKHLYLLHKKYYKIPISYELYVKILNKFFSKMVDEITDNQYAFDLPFQLGYLTILRKKTTISFDSNGKIKKHGTTYPVDNKKTREARNKGTRKLIYDLDVDYVYAFKWFRGNFPNRTAYFLKPLQKIRTKLYHKAYEKS